MMNTQKIGALLLALLMLVGCTGRALKLEADDNERQVELTNGQTLAIALDSNPTTGYGWYVVECDESILRQQGEPKYKAESRRVGAGGTETLRFQAAAPGQTILVLGYLRPWEKDVDPIKSYRVEVVVR